jgi:hypothetical protein
MHLLCLIFSAMLAFTASLNAADTPEAHEFIVDAAVIDIINSSSTNIDLTLLCPQVIDAIFNYAHKADDEKILAMFHDKLWTLSTPLLIHTILNSRNVKKSVKDEFFLESNYEKIRLKLKTASEDKLLEAVRQLSLNPQDETQMATLLLTLETVKYTFIFLANINSFSLFLMPQDLKEKIIHLSTLASIANGYIQLKPVYDLVHSQPTPDFADVPDFWSKYVAIFDSKIIITRLKDEK